MIDRGFHGTDLWCVCVCARFAVQRESTENDRAIWYVSSLSLKAANEWVFFALCISPISWKCCESLLNSYISCFECVQMNEWTAKTVAEMVISRQWAKRMHTMNRILIFIFFWNRVVEFVRCSQSLHLSVIHEHEHMGRTNNRKNQFDVCRLQTAETGHRVKRQIGMHLIPKRQIFIVPA